jgi:hypothetical protein
MKSVLLKQTQKKEVRVVRDSDSKTVPMREEEFIEREEGI